MKQGSTQLSALPRFFSSTVIGELARMSCSPLFRRLLVISGLVDRLKPSSTVAEAFETAFNLLKVAGHRDEYIYRAALTQKVFLGTHSLRTASMLHEFRTGTCKADLVVLNGSSTVYEIKSERDNLTRLVNQIESYQHVFAAVNVIASVDHIKGVCVAVPADVGILSLSKRYQITTIREAIPSAERINPLCVFDSIQSKEALAILTSLGIFVPDVPNTKLRTAMRVHFANLDPVTLHTQMVTILKRTRSVAPLANLVHSLPTPLHAAALSLKLRKGDHERLIGATKTSLEETRGWI